jgi:hypothetical protein
MEESFTEVLFSTYSLSFLTDEIIRLRYVGGRRAASESNNGGEDAARSP